ncbi:MAG: hypothetical protein GY811_10125 [Myxococcales bacterium]|nr:hypothetical protein [Myxococcales bacterium]
MSANNDGFLASYTLDGELIEQRRFADVDFVGLQVRESNGCRSDCDSGFVVIPWA